MVEYYNLDRRAVDAFEYLVGKPEAGIGIRSNPHIEDTKELRIAWRESEEDWDSVSILQLLKNYEEATVATGFMTFEKMLIAIYHQVVDPQRQAEETIQNAIDGESNDL